MKFGIFSILPCLFRKRAEMRLSCHRHDSWELGPKFSTQKCNKHEFFCLVFKLTRTWPQFSKNTLSSKHVLHCITENLNEILMIPEKISTLTPTLTESDIADASGWSLWRPFRFYYHIPTLSCILAQEWSWIYQFQAKFQK